jgi:hypothetical protein
LSKFGVLNQGMNHRPDLNSKRDIEVDYYLAYLHRGFVSFLPHDLGTMSPRLQNNANLGSISKTIAPMVTLLKDFELPVKDPILDLEDGSSIQKVPYLPSPLKGVSKGHLMGMVSEIVEKAENDLLNEIVEEVACGEDVEIIPSSLHIFQIDVINKCK